MRIALLTLFSAFLLSACSVLDPAEDIPSYVNIDYVSFSVSANEGSASAAITDAWIYLDGELLGAYEIPCKVPVLAEGAHTLLVLPGVKQNGMSTLRAIYPFYKGWESTVVLTRGRITTVEPAFTYFAGTNFVWNCEFYAQATNFNAWNHPGYAEEAGAEAFEIRSAKVELSNAAPYFLGTSSDSFLLDPANELYLECNYKCDQAFTIGLRNCTTGDIIRWLEVAPSANWNKIYVRLNDALIGLPSDNYYSVSFEMSKPETSATSTLRLDNLKLIN